MGHLFGTPFHRQLQRRIILEALDFLTSAKASGEVRRLSLTWAQARRESAKLANRF